MGAKRGNTNAKKDGRGRLAAPLSISDARLVWAAEQVQKQGKEPTDENVKEFIRVYCYNLIDMAQDVAVYHNYEPDEFLQSVASGEIATVLLPDEQRSMAIGWLFEQAKQIVDPSLSQAVASIARQLEAAAMREAESED